MIQISHNIPNAKLKHLNYIDALRGFTMILVVYLHFVEFSLGISEAKGSSLCSIFSIIRMPLFFCVSGFFAYGCYDIALFKKRLKNRLCSQLWPTVFFCFLFVFVFNAHEIIGGGKNFSIFRDVLFENHKSGYWFTYCLVQVFIIFAIISLVLNYLKASKKLRFVIYLLCFLWCIFLNVSIFKYFNGLTKTKIALALSLNYILNYSAWFYFGAILRLAFNRLTALMDKKCYLPMVLTIFIASYMFHEQYIVTITRNIASASGILTLIACFYYSRKFWDSDKLLSRMMIAIGTATLPVYLYHYFFIHSIAKIPGIADFSGIVGIWYLEIPFVMSCSVAIAILCVGIDNLLKHYTPHLHNFIYQNSKNKK